MSLSRPSGLWLGRRPPCSSPHFIPHLVVHGDALPVLKVAAVGTGRSRACPRCHYPRPEPQSLSRRPTTGTTGPSCPHNPLTSPQLATLTAARFCEDNFRPLYLRRTDSVVTPPRTRTCTLSRPRPGLRLPLWSARKLIAAGVIFLSSCLDRIT